MSFRNITLLLPVNVHQYAQYDWHLAKQPWPPELTQQPANKKQSNTKMSISIKLLSLVFVLFHSFRRTNLVLGSQDAYPFSVIKYSSTRSLAFDTLHTKLQKNLPIYFSP